VPKFDAGKEIQDIEYDLSKFGGPVGVVEEPSQISIRKFAKQAEDMFGSSDPDEINKKMSSQTTEEAFEMLDAQMGMISELCGGTPTVEDLQKLPARVLKAFLGYLMGELMGENPPLTSGIGA
jgi:hypothetical protein